MRHIFKYALYAIVTACIAAFWLACGIAIATLTGYAQYTFAWWMLVFAWPFPTSVAIAVLVFVLSVSLSIARSIGHSG
jgi:hypothetical protein